MNDVVPDFWTQRSNLDAGGALADTQPKKKLSSEEVHEETAKYMYMKCGSTYNLQNSRVAEKHEVSTPFILIG